MASPPPPPPDDAREPEIADATSLFRDPPASRAAPDTPLRPTAPVEPGHYEIEAGEPPPRAHPVADPTVPESRATGPDSARTGGPSKPRLEPSAAVDQVWTRGAEWGSTIAVLALAGLGLFVLVYVTLALELYVVALLELLVGGLGLALLSYPILITLERPVRITPEQAVGDYFAALSHHVPHYRRMWLLLSHAGRVSGAFASFEGFKGYWRGRLAELKAGHASALTPLKFQVVDFRAPKSAGRSEIEVSFTVQVIVRGQAGAGPVEQVRVSTTLVKGPDRQWYLDRGTLP